MNTRLNDVESTQQSLVTNQQQLTKRAECNEMMITELQERLSTMATANTGKSVAGKKNISNLHPGLKPIIQPIFFDLCGIDVKNTTRTKRIELLAKNDPLPSGDAFEMVNGVQIWRPRWGENIDDTMKMSYIAAVVQRSFRNDPKKKTEMKDEDYNRVTISTVAESYWRNLNYSYNWWIWVANNRREAVPEFKKIYECEESVALIDTDYGTDYLSYVKDQLSEDSANRCKEQNMGKGSRKADLTYRLLLVCNVPPYLAELEEWIADEEDNAEDD
ncbi:hypothetical protein K503DRAFT_804837 [Rhizopogon vinicolor AM-OR11-026]|uniref:Uncharacterized protein n=1 Tax=Rhizopogon vinicolor AM-OR11-026 TaxID=1314800 RepID=A0A1B7MJV8_9AGAM|nr:hypothetical protein K503DRAFT_804837 [Rhizopogon vinicolor AM-OR11-026]